MMMMEWGRFYRLEVTDSPMTNYMEEISLAKKKKNEFDRSLVHIKLIVIEAEAK